MVKLIRVLAIMVLAFLAGSLTSGQTKPDKDYLAYVVSEAADKIALIRFGPNGAHFESSH
jgi:hypothetical protein